MQAAPKADANSVPADFLALLLGAGLDIQFPEDEPEPDSPPDPTQQKNDNQEQVVPVAIPVQQPLPPPVSIRLALFASFGETKPIQADEPEGSELPSEASETKQTQCTAKPSLAPLKIEVADPKESTRPQADRSGANPQWLPVRQMLPVQNQPNQDAAPSKNADPTRAGDPMPETLRASIPVPEPPRVGDPVPEQPKNSEAAAPGRPAPSARSEATELAFSLKIEPAAVQPAAQNSNTNTGEQHREDKRAQFEMPVAVPSKETAAAQPQQSFFSTTSTQINTERAPAPEPAAAPAVIQVPEPARETAKSAPIRELSLQLPAGGDKSVDLHIVDDRGKLHVEVRTSDVQLASSLRDNVGDLVQKLDHSGYRTEARDQVAATGAASRSNQSGPDGGKSSSEQDRQPGGQGGHSGQPQQQGHGRGNRPRWLEEIVTNFRAAAQKEQETQWQSIQ